MKDKKICELCENVIVKTKGARKEVHEWELQHSAHMVCAEKHAMLGKHFKITPNDQMIAIINGLVEMFPDVEKTTPMLAFKAREAQWKKAIEENFPLLTEKMKEAENTSNDNKPDRDRSFGK